MDATLSDRRSSVVSSNTVGNTEKSSGRRAFRLTSITIIASAMFIVNSTSSMKVGNGNTIIARISNTSPGTARRPTGMPSTITPCALTRSPR